MKLHFKSSLIFVTDILSVGGNFVTKSLQASDRIVYFCGLFNETVSIEDSVTSNGGRDSLLSVVMGWAIRGSKPSKAKMVISFQKSPDRFWNPPSSTLNWYGHLFPGIKRQLTWGSPLTYICCRD